MAFSVTTRKSDVMGSMQAKIFQCTFTGVTAGKITTGLSNVVAAFFQPEKNDDHGILYRNYSDAGVTAKGGDIYIDGVAAGEVGTLMVFGN
jgi:hypothetical protein